MVVSGYGDAALSNDMKESFRSSQHPFSELVVMQDGDGAIKMERDLIIPAWRMIRKSNATMDVCDAPVSNRWFMLTNTYHKLAPYTDIMVAPDYKPVIHYTSAYHCSKNSDCKLILDDARRFYPSLDKVVLDFDMIYHEETRNAFCQAWKTANMTTNSIGMPTAASYVAYLYSQNWAEYLYSFSDKHLHGSYDAFIRVSISPPNPTASSPLQLSGPPMTNQSFETSHSVDQGDFMKNDAERRERWKKIMDQEFKPQELLIPCEEFERIKIIRRLGEGERKTADEGRHNRLEVVVKRLKEGRYRTMREYKYAKRNGLKEAAVLYQLRNASNVMRMIGWCNYTTVMNGVINTTVVDLIKKKETTNTHRMLEISLDIARSMQQVHEQGFLHNDIKPNHFLINKKGKVLLDDFDQVRIPIGGGIPELRPFSTNPYRPPEELAGKPKDLPSDIYALSLVLWSLWAKSEIPYPNWDRERSKYVGQGRLRPNLAELKDCPEPLQRVLVQGWDHDPSRRPTASQIVQQLETLVEMSSRTVAK